MSLEWSILSNKEKKCIKLALKNNDGVVSVHLIDNVYTSENPREKIKKFANNGLIESINLGNKFRVVEDKIPEKVLEEVN